MSTRARKLRHTAGRFNLLKQCLRDRKELFDHANGNAYLLVYVTQKVNQFITFELEMDVTGNTRQNIGYLWPLVDW